MSEESEAKDSWEIVSYRLQQWRGFYHAPACAFCRSKNYGQESTKLDIRTTPIGDCCILCWLNRDVCEVCGVGVVAPGESRDTPLIFRGKQVCVDCLLPDIPMDAWKDWLLYFVYTPRSSFVQVLEDYFAEDFERRREDARGAAIRRQKEMDSWGLSSVRAS